MRALFDFLILASLSGFILWQLSPADLIRNTTTVGGDTPSHLYLVSHLRHELFHHGRIISWAGGWWCGFPMFQYYFVLPYLAAALLSVVIPLNIAFKLASVAGLVLTPLCAYWAGRLWRLPRPTPVVLAIAMVPFLFVHAHTMWGVNTASTLAGMIANSWSFALLLPALASSCRDAGDGTFRWRTVLLMVLVLASHFFTSVVMFLSLAIVPVVCNPASSRREEKRRQAAALQTAFSVLVQECLLAVLLMSWWIVPLVMKSGFSMDFGTNWQVTLWKSFPEYTAGLLVFAAVAVWSYRPTLCGWRGFPPCRPTLCGWRGPRRGQSPGLHQALSSVDTSRSSPVWLLCWMLAISVVLFKYGFALSPVFVNVRLWPFIFFSVVALAAVGLGSLLSKIRGSAFLVILITVGVLMGTQVADSLSGRITGPGLTRVWAGWNYSGYESKPAASVFETLLPLLKGTPGRLANDLSEENNQLGSSRVFELIPYLIGKPVLEGGLVNSALGSMYSYSIQGETSDSCAGFPPIVTPQSFNITNATRHLELFNVKHFIARSERTKQALRSNPAWRLMAGEKEWELFELTSHDGRYVFIPSRMPVVVETARWKECSLDWLYTPQALDQFAIWGEGSGGHILPNLIHVQESQFQEHLADVGRGYVPGAGDANRRGLAYKGEGDANRRGLAYKGEMDADGNHLAPLIAEAGTSCISHEEVADDHIRFTTSAIGRPHIIKVSWFPNWKVRGASRVYRVSPGFMLVFPDRENVELYYGTVWSDWVGYGLTLIGLLAVVMMVFRCSFGRNEHG